MPERRYSWPAGHWDWYQHLAFKHGVAAGDLVFVGGQVDKDSSGAPLRPHDLPAQTGVVIGHIDAVLRELGAGLADVTRLVAFYATFPQTLFGLPRLPVILYAGSFVMAALVWLLCQLARPLRAARAPL